jgi:hypothetical protein
MQALPVGVVVSASWQFNGEAAASVVSFRNCESPKLVADLSNQVSIARYRLQVFEDPGS